ncbi:hypothetical protein E7744_10245 [Citricoccus sp. SGAir0253]|uniref:hypothetical protein n=1 Tax=Citricoccus sp. SGAir0253 TaxID=2567881 RepID=UPI0010CCFB6F|nr:hypothetical protein [Citricoccus sp. SGAir0253]QCU78491.1 hypothetical protein E7744_10245 [Citricoccus sp. SGAir0253]
MRNHRPFPTGVRVADAERFVFTHARLLERRRVDLLLHGGDQDGVLAALGAYRNPDGGFGHGLEPDLRSPLSEPLSTLAALDLLAGWGLADHPWVRTGLEWAAATSGLDGSLPFMTEPSRPWPRAPWVEPGPAGSLLTFGFAAAALRTGFTGGWSEAAVAWCHARLGGPAPLPAYEVKYALRFLSAELAVLGASASAPGADAPPALPATASPAPDDPAPRAFPSAAASAGPGVRAAEAVRADLARLRERLGEDGGLPVAGGAEGERLRPWDFAGDPWSGTDPRSGPDGSGPIGAAGGAAGAVFTAAQLAADLERVAGGQHADGGWTVDWPAWCPAQGHEWRGIRTVESLELLSAAAPA